MDRLGNAIKTLVTRGKVAGAVVGPRTLMQITGMDGVTQQVVELLLPPGYSARPVAGADLLLLQVMGSGDHVVALGGDLAGGAIANLAPGEFGLSDGTQMVVFRVGNMIQMISPTKVRVEAPVLECTGQIIANCDAAGASVALGTHLHPPGTGVTGSGASTDDTGPPVPGT
jgi:phage gp45-like